MAKEKTFFMDERLMAVAAIVLGILVLIAPSILNYVVAGSLIVWGVSKFL